MPDVMILIKSLQPLNELDVITIVSIRISHSMATINNLNLNDDKTYVCECIYIFHP